MGWLLLVSRVVFGGFFVFSGVNHFTRLPSISGYVKDQGVPAPELAVLLSGVLLVLGGLSVLLGLLPRIGLTLLVVFLVPVTLIMHAFWNVSDPMRRQLEMGHFLRNFALAAAA